MEQRAGDEEPVALAAGERQAAGDQARLEAAGHGQQVLQEPHLRERRLHLPDRDVVATQAKVVEEAGREDVLRTQDHDLAAELLQVPRTQVEPVDEDGAGGRLAHRGDEVEQGTATTALGAAQGDAVTGGDLEAHFLEEFTAARVGEADPAQGDRRAGRGTRRDFPTLAVGVEVDQVAQFIDGGQGVIPGLELLAELGDGGDHGADDEVARDELAKRELLAEHQAPADDQEGGRGEHLEGQQADDLPHEHAEMPTAVREVAARKLVGAGRGELQPRRPLEEPRVAGDLLQPAHHCVLAPRLGQAGGNRAPAEHEDHEGQAAEDDEHVGEQEGMVEAQHQQADDGADDDVDAVEQEHRRALLDGDHVEEAVDHLGRVHPIEGLGLHARQAPRHVRGEPHEDAALDVLRDHVLQAADDGREDEAAAERKRDEDQRLLEGRRLGAEGEVADHAVDRERQGEVEQSGDQAEDEDGRDVGDFGLHQPEEAAHGGGMVAELGVVVAREPFGRERRRDERHLDLGLGRSQAEFVDQRETADDLRLLIPFKGGDPLAEEAAADDHGPAGLRRMENQR